MTAAAPPRRSNAAVLAGYLRPRPLGAFLLGISSGFPLTLLAATLTFWLAKRGVDRKAIGFALAIGTPYTLKFLWAPLVDGIALPGLTRLVGQRRAWLITVQALLVAFIIVWSGTDPIGATARFAALGLVVAFLGATQDIVIDAYRIETLPEHEFAQGTATNQVGYRTGNLLAGAGTIWLASTEGAHIGWPHAYALTALLVLPGAFASLWLGPGRRTAVRDEPFTAAAFLHFLHHNVAEPFMDFFGRPGAVTILLFVAVYKLGDAVGQGFLAKMTVEQGFSDGQYIAINKLVGFWALVAGSLVAGSLVARLGIVRLLIGAGLIMMGANLLFAAVAATGHSVPLLTLAVGTENLFSAISLTVFATYLSGLSSTAFTATQYALLSSIAAVARTFAGAPAGYAAAALGWPGFYVLCACLGLPGILLVLLLWRRGFVVETAKQQGVK